MKAYPDRKTASKISGCIEEERLTTFMIPNINFKLILILLNLFLPYLLYLCVCLYTF